MNTYKSLRTWAAGSALLSLTLVTACGGTSGSQAGGADGTASSGEKGKEAGTAGPFTLTVSVMTSNRVLEMAKMKFEESHPNAKVEIKESIAAPVSDGKTVIRTMGAKTDPKDLEKFVSTVNTELMSGKASDIIITDGSFPYKKYADKKLLEPINELMKNDGSFKRDDYYANVFDAMLYKKAIYALPAKLSINWLLGNQAVLGGAKFDDGKWTWDDFKATAESITREAAKNGNTSSYAMIATSGEQLLSKMVDSSFAKLVDYTNKKFDSELFANMLKLSKSMADSKLITPERPERADTMFQSFNPNQYEDMILLSQMQFDGKGAFYKVPSFNEAKGLSFTSDMLLSINAKSGHKKEAWEFVKLLLSEDMQKMKEMSGFAVNRKASLERQAQLKEIGQSDGKNQIRIMGKDGKEFKPRAPEQKDIDMIEAALSGLQLYAEIDPKVRAIIEQESGPFFSGQKTAEDTAKTVQAKVNTYLQE
ncbi:ABC transporter substrate-binding protein [Paenibacillus ginsengarvi]|uniref:Extracellular solute-binding protein n=1 Tax=Paenibacillus ginsengarvi TaxID=400777 RepID=A0A3B0CL93_9BACL|nr:extracellular solute-binding protein [Paenibacillus ginsengarvi]RKN84766.1 extracellular solute-binding protein [Paenibacillus ginsengarvi]